MIHDQRITGRTAGDLAAEKTIVLAVVGEPKLLDYVVDLVRPADFGTELLRRIYTVVLELVAERQPVTPVAVQVRFDPSHSRPDWYDGGAEARRATGEDLRAVARRLAEIGQRDRLEELGREIADRAQERPATETAAAYRALADGLLDRPGEASAVTGRQAVEARAAEVEAALQDPDRLPATFETGLRAFDRVTGGLAVGRLCVFAGRPSQGKSALAVAIAHHLAVTGVRAALFWLEDERSWFADRLAARHVGLPFPLARGEDVSARARAIRAADLSALDNVLVDSAKALTPDQLVSRMRRLARAEGVRVFIVDHLGELRLSGGQWSERHDLALGDAVRAFRNAAEELRCAPVLFSQMNRQAEGRPDDAPPRMSDVQGSGQIEQTARTLAFLRRGQGPGDFQLVVRKPVQAVIDLAWDEARATVSNPRPPVRVVYPPQSGAEDA